MLEALGSAGIFLVVLFVAAWAGGATFFLLGMRNMEMSGIADAGILAAVVFVGIVLGGVWWLL